MCLLISLPRNVVLLHFCSTQIQHIDWIGSEPADIRAREANHFIVIEQHHGRILHQDGIQARIVVVAHGFVNNRLGFLEYFVKFWIDIMGVIGAIGLQVLGIE